MVDQKDELRIRAEIREILMGYWDPIGINDEPACADEYDSYLGGCLQLLINQGTDNELADYFRQIMRDLMGVPRMSQR